MVKDAEERVSIGVLKIAAANAKGIATFNKCRSDIPGMVKLTPADLAPSATRPGEPMWHQIVRNIKSHDGEDSNFIKLGRLEHIPRVGYRITAAGKAYLKKRGA